jgi:hypothetical protein
LPTIRQVAKRSPAHKCGNLSRSQDIFTKAVICSLQTGTFCNESLYVLFLLFNAVIKKNKKMKNLILFIFATLMAACSFGQKLSESDVPANVKAKMNASFPEVKSVKWSKEDNNYEAEFISGKKEMSCVINPAAELLETETEISAAELPAVIKAKIEEQFPGCKINEAAKMESKGVITYEAETKIQKESFDLIYKEDGTFVSKTKITEEEKD